MPNFDKTGPCGQGPMTGQGSGSCDEKNQLNMRKGCGMGFGGGKGMCRRNLPANSSVSIEDQEKFLENKLKDIRELKNNANSKQ